MSFARRMPSAKCDKMKKKINLLHVVRPAEGGIKNHLLYLLRLIDAANFNVMVACPPDGSIYKELKNEGVKIYPLPIKGDFNPFFDLRAAGVLAGIIRQEKVTILHAHSIKAALVGRLAATASRVPGLVYTLHNSFFYNSVPKWQRWLAAKMERCLARRTDAVIAVSEALKVELTALIGIEPGRVVTIANGIDTGHYKPASGRGESRRKLGLGRGMPIIGTVARLAPQKGVTHLIRAAKILKDVFLKGKPFQLVIVGDGPLRPSLEEETRLYDLDGSVTFEGVRGNIPDYLNAFDVFVLPSETEGLPLVLLEAMAAGLPVVASKVGGIPEVIENNLNGLLVSPANPFEIAESIVRILDKPLWAGAMGRRGRAKIQNEFNAHNMVDRVCGVYNDILDRKGC